MFDLKLNSSITIFFLVANKERPASPPKQEKVPASASTNKSGAKGGKGGKDKGKDKDKDGKGSRPPSQAFDQSKPHWTLRVVSDDKESVSTISGSTLVSLLSCTIKGLRIVVFTKC